MKLYKLLVCILMISLLKSDVLTSSEAEAYDALWEELQGLGGRGKDAALAVYPHISFDKATRDKRMDKWEKRIGFNRNELPPHKSELTAANLPDETQKVMAKHADLLKNTKTLDDATLKKCCGKYLK